MNLGTGRLEKRTKKPRYWLSVIDAANAIAHLANSGNHYSPIAHVRSKRMAM